MKLIRKQNIIAAALFGALAAFLLSAARSNADV